jgi:serine protease Do
LGVNVRPAGSDGETGGLVVQRVDPSGAAAAAGIRAGDVIISVGGVEIRREEDLTSIVDIMHAGDQIEFQILRRGKPEKVMVQFGDPPASQPDLNFTPGDDYGAAAGSSESAPIVRVAARDNNDILKSVLVRDHE